MVVMPRRDSLMAKPERSVPERLGSPNAPDQKRAIVEKLANYS
jgi:hypothetical protein